MANLGLRTEFSISSLFLSPRMYEKYPGETNVSFRYSNETGGYKSVLHHVHHDRNFKTLALEYPRGLLASSGPLFFFFPYRGISPCKILTHLIPSWYLRTWTNTGNYCSTEHCGKNMRGKNYLWLKSGAHYWNRQAVWPRTSHKYLSLPQSKLQHLTK